MHTVFASFGEVEQLSSAAKSGQSTAPFSVASKLATSVRMSPVAISSRQDLLNCVIFRTLLATC